MEKSNQLTGAPLVWFREVEIPEVENEPIAVLRSVDSTSIATDDHAHLSELLQYVRRRGLSTAVHHCYLCRPQLPEAVLKQHSAQQTAASKHDRMSSQCIKMKLTCTAI